MFLAPEEDKTVLDLNSEVGVHSVSQFADRGDPT
jgi:hypothetical protein